MRITVGVSLTNQPEGVCHSDVDVGPLILVVTHSLVRSSFSGFDLVIQPAHEVGGQIGFRHAASARSAVGTTHPPAGRSRPVIARTPVVST